MGPPFSARRDHPRGQEGANAVYHLVCFDTEAQAPRVGTHCANDGSEMVCVDQLIDPVSSGQLIVTGTFNYQYAPTVIGR